VEISVVVNPSADNWIDCPHLVTRSGTTITWDAPAGDYWYSSADSLIFCFLYS